MRFGMNVHSQDIKRPTIPAETLTLVDFQRIKSWGLDTVQFCLEWDKMQNSGSYPNIGSVIDEDFMKRLDRAVDAANQAGLDVILKVFTDRWACLNGGRCIESLYTNPTAQEDFIRLWEFLAARYGSRVVAFQLLNEPRPTTGTHGNWTDAERQAMVNAWNLGGFSHRLIERVRAISSNTIIFIFGYNRHYDRFVENTPRPFSNIIYGFSFYVPYEVAEECALWEHDKDWILGSSRLTNAVNFRDTYNVPILVQEIGLHSGCVDPNHLMWLDDALKALNEAGVPWFYYVYGHWQRLGFCVIDEYGEESPVVDVIRANIAAAPVPPVPPSPGEISGAFGVLGRLAIFLAGIAVLRDLASEEVN